MLLSWGSSLTPTRTTPLGKAERVVRELEEDEKEVVEPYRERIEKMVRIKMSWVSSDGG